MADNGEKSKFGLKGLVNMPQKKELKQSEPIEEAKTEKAVKQIHSTTGKTVRLSLDVPEDLYPELKMKQIKKGFKTTRDYLLDLINKDLNE